MNDEPFNHEPNCGNTRVREPQNVLKPGSTLVPGWWQVVRWNWQVLAAV